MESQTIVRKLLGEGIKAVPDSKPKNEETKDRDSAVAIILVGAGGKAGDKKSFPSKMQIVSAQLEAMKKAEVLLLQRTSDGKAYSGDICLPGGKV
jgi:8-oxo-dGTP pyrophosphatase MutT (NUDIX family)